MPEPAPDFDSRPEAIRRAIEARIIEGKMRPGDRLGLKSDLQKEFDVAGPTIAQALTLLTNDGLISMRRGPGGGIFVERSRPVIRVGTRRLATGTAQSLAENIETREWLTPLLAVSAARSVRPRRGGRGAVARARRSTGRGAPVVRHPTAHLGRSSCARRAGRQRVARPLLPRPPRHRRGAHRRRRLPVRGHRRRPGATANRHPRLDVRGRRRPQHRGGPHHAELVRLVSRPLRESTG